jgi:hypothetical protein
LQEKTPLLRVPDDGAFDPHATACELFGAATWQNALATPDFASVSVMLQATFCDAAETSTLPGTRVKFVNAGATVSGSEVTPSPATAGVRFAVFPTASVALPPGVQVPEGE